MIRAAVVALVAFVPMIGEARRSRRHDRALRATPLGSSFIAGACLFALAKGLKYWAIATLGTRWTFRVLVPPGQPLIAGGPYRLMRHPNYAGVAGEIAGAALIGAAPIAGVVSLLLFGSLMLARIRVEERALGGL